MALGQLRFPRALRIADPGPLPDLLDESALRLMFPSPVASSDGLPDSLALKIANTAWRLTNQVQRLGECRSHRAVRNRVEMLSELLRAEGIEILDFTGRDLDQGEVWDQVLSSAELKEHPFIAAMDAPRILYRGRMLQAGTPRVEERATNGSSIGEHT